MRPSAWVAQAAYDTALREHLGTGTDRQAAAALLEELREHRRVLANIGGNVNDLARVANSTGQLEHAAALATVLRLVANVVHAADTMLTDVRRRLLP
ncbi:hypothetical protein [Amycolatopsis sp. WGS_07]|uniref:hypothetical protein n=1 Tax=Amycolatopsis sp. WGS_07 TaxID=3076764 RepID=UPI003872F007